MFGHFPAPYHDELFYNLCVRYHHRHGQGPNIRTITTLFGTNTIRLSTDLPSRLDYLSQQLPPGYPYTANDFINRHTHFPAYAAFFPSNRTHQILDSMHGARESGINILLGLPSSGVATHQYLMYCPECLDEDGQRFGEPYWHLHHQFPGVFYCARHNVRLHQSQFPARGLRHFHRPADIGSQEDAQASEPTGQQKADFLYLAQNVVWLLTHPFPSTPSQLTEKYRAALIGSGFATYSGNIKTQQLVSAFQNRFAESFLSQLGCSLEARHRRNWLARIVQAQAVQHPLRHLLLLRLLDLNVWDLPQLESELMPFGRGPYPCLNPICPHYRQPFIPDYQPGYSRRAGRHPKATFTCPDCGYTYARLGPDICAEDRYRGKVVRYGNKWDRLFISLWTDPHITHREARARLGVGIDTLYRQARRLGLRGEQDDARQNHVQENIEVYRERWLQAVRENPGCGMADLRMRYTDIYGYLYAHDANWLAQHKPADPRQAPRASRIRVDWAARDNDYHQRILDIREQLFDCGRRPERVTCNTIGKAIGLTDGTLPRDLDKLPQTAALVQSLIESHEAFALRRIEHVCQLYLAVGGMPTVAQFSKRAGLSRAVQVTEVMEQVQTCVDFLAEQ